MKKEEVEGKIISLMIIIKQQDIVYNVSRGTGTLLKLAILIFTRISGLNGSLEILPSEGGLLASLA